MDPLSFEAARACVIGQVSRVRALPAIETADLLGAAGRVLAEDIAADRDCPASSRSVRDGFAVRAADLPGTLRVTGEVRAGETSSAAVRPGEAIEIMTGAPVPEGADAIIMVEHVIRGRDSIRCDRAAAPGQFLNRQGSEMRAGDLVLRRGRRLGFAEVALLAAVGREAVPVFAEPRVALLATGDEIVPVSASPESFQVRNSNVYSLAVQVERAGGIPEILPVARDEESHTRELILRGLRSDLLLISGGVSAGKYDLVERVLAGCGAEFFFDRVLIQPGQPLVFGRAGGAFFFGLPGNPVSTMITFEAIARAALEMLGGQDAPSLPLTLARLTRDFRHKPGLTRFLPACLSPDGSQITPAGWQGSSDIAAVCRGNAFLVTEPGREEWKAGDLIRVLLR